MAKDDYDGIRDDYQVSLQDEDGNDVVFEHLMTVKYREHEYILLEAKQDIEGCMQGESIILRVEQDESGEDIYVTIEDEDEYRTVFDKCVEAIGEMDDDDAADQ
ncbi:MAG: DUF1292 domain-containing protein [Clostridiales bacterium]|nr:DUF1292 domain-containing protein [Clostridiales bacterium]